MALLKPKRFRLAFFLGLVFSYSGTVFAATSTPSSIGGLSLWLDGSDSSSVVRDGSNLVSQWNDKSGGGNNAVQASGAIQPVWVSDVPIVGKGVLRFDGTKGMSGTILTPFGTSTIFAVGNVSTSSLTQTYFDLSTTTNSLSGTTLYTNPASVYRLAVYPGQQTGGFVNSVGYRAGYHLISGAVSSASNTIFIDNVLTTAASSTITGSIPVVPYNRFSIGQLASGLFKANGDIAEVIMYNRVLSVAERESVEAYLAEKYGLASVPSAAVGLLATPGNTSVSLGWSAPSNTGTSTISDYQIDYKLGSDSNYSSFAHSPSTATSIVVTGLTNGQSYDFRVAAVNKIGTSTAFAVASAIPVPSVPSIPTVRFGTVGSSTASLVWTPPSDDGGSAVTSYLISYATGGATSTVSVSGTSTSYDLVGLTNGSAYTVSVSATNISGTSSPSNYVQFTPSSTFIPLNFSGVSLWLDGSDSSSVVRDGSDLVSQWTDKSSFGNSAIQSTGSAKPTWVANTPVSGVGVLRFDGARWMGGLINASSSFATSTIFVVGNLATSSQVRTYFEFSTTTVALSGTTMFTAADSTVRLARYFGSQSTLSRTNNVYQPGYHVFSGVALGNSGTLSTDRGATNAETTTAVADIPQVLFSRYTVGALADQSTFKAVGDIGEMIVYNRALSDYERQSVEAYLLSKYGIGFVPNAPTDVSVLAGNAGVDLSWTAAAVSGTVPVTNYAISYSSGGATTTVMTGGVTTAYSLTGLSNGTEYAFQVSAVSIIGTSTLSNIAIATPQPTVPSVPLSFSVIPGSGSALLSWAAPEDDGGGSVSSYSISYQSSAGAETIQASASTTTRLVTGLTNLAPYTFTVAANNVIGTGSSTRSITVVPGVPSGLTAPAVPYATNVRIRGGLNVGSILTGLYTFVDPNGDDEGASTYRWLRGSGPDGDFFPIVGATQSYYVLTDDDIGAYLKFEIHPQSVAYPKVGVRSLTGAEGRVGESGGFIYQVLSTGQSLSLGAEGFPALTSASPYGNLMLTGGATAPGTTFTSLSETSRGAESMSSSLANTMSSFFSGLLDVFAVATQGVGGSSYGAIKKGTSPYATSTLAVSNSFTAAQALGKQYRVSAVTVVHGETDRASARGVYQGYLEQWQNDYETDLKAITGQEEDVPLFTDQMSAAATDPNLGGGGRIFSYVPTDQLAASVDNPGKIYLVTPKYIFKYVGGSDGYHMLNYSYRQLGQYYAKAMSRVLLEGRDWKPLSPREVVRKDNVIYARFWVPSRPLTFDTTNVVPTVNYGFEYKDDADSASIQSVEILNADTVKVTLDQIPVGANQYLRYAFSTSSAATSSPGYNMPGSLHGNLRDSDETAPLYDDAPEDHYNHLYNWSVHFNEPIEVHSVAMISDVAVEASSTSASITWASSEPGSTVVDFGLNSSYGSSTDEEDLDNKVLGHRAEITGLASCTIYHYRARSRDIAEQSFYSGDDTFMTGGCVDSSASSISRPPGGRRRVAEAARSVFVGLGMVDESRMSVQDPISITENAGTAEIFSPDVSRPDNSESSLVDGEEAPMIDGADISATSSLSTTSPTHVLSQSGSIGSFLSKIGGFFRRILDVFGW